MADHIVRRETTNPSGVIRSLVQRWAFVAVCVVLCGWATAQKPVSLSTRDTVLQIEAGAESPAVLSLASPGNADWRNTGPETLIDHADVDGHNFPLHWKLLPSACRSDAHSSVFVYESQSPHMRLSWEWIARADFGPIEHTIHIENLDSRELWIPLQPSFSARFHVDAGQPLHHFYVEKGADTPSPEGVHEVAVSDGYRWSGYSSTYAHPREGFAREIIPWSVIYRDDAAHSGWYVGMEFSGRTQLQVERDGMELAAAAGLDPEPGPFRTRLAPGETFDSPTVFVGVFNAGPDGAGNILRPWVRQVLGNPKTWADPNYPYTVNNSWGSGMAVDAALARRMIQDSAEMGLEMFHLDAGWFRGVGDWYPDPSKFPDGLAPIAEDAHRHGLKFGIWVDWTQAAFDTEPGALNARDPKVKDWLVTDLPPGWKPEPFKGQTTDIGLPAAHDYALSETRRIIKDFHLDMLEHDGYLVAQGCVRSDHPHAAPDTAHMSIQKDSGSYFVYSSNSTDVSYHAVRAYYDIYSKLRQEHPGLIFEICNDGGRMVDFGSAAHGDYFSITDTYDPLSNRRAFYDTSYALPAAMLEDYVEKWPTPAIENFRYMLRSGMMGWLTIMQDTNAWTPEQHLAAKQEIALYKAKLRPLIRDSNLYHISPRPDGVRWDGMQFFDPQRGAGVVYAFRGSVADESTHTFQLHGMRREQKYRLHFQDGTSPDSVATGSQLMDTGLTVALKTPNSSELIFLEEQR